MPVGFKDRHVSTNLRKDEKCGQICDAGDRCNPFDLSVILMASEKEHCFNPINGFVDNTNVGFCMGHFEFLLFQDMVSVDRIHDFVFGSFHQVVDEGTAFFFIKWFIGKQVIHDTGGRNAERVCQDTVNSDTGNRHAVLVTVLFRCTHVRKFQTVTGQFTESPDVCRRNKRGFDDIKAEQVSDPFCITFVSFLAFDGFHLLGMCEDDMHVRFKDIKNGNLVFTGGFHTDIVAVLCEKPVAQGNDI